ncbi:MazG-like family protein [Tissierella sp. MSJ-40]|uniref:MazG-like family protein n=1 Tax=Tissierella simiarum TaxID=2841534 RepID=A0ABS6E8U9_9FIRM|nr:MazG-like family protein [Tissierella simiarum]MBU5439350.1 MazG-like family protein [Tissierella simiarum]
METKDIDIIKNVRTIEWLKSQLLTTVANLYEVLAKGEEDTKENLENVISDIILQSYVLGKRLGLSYKDINSTLKENIKLNLIEDHKIERWYGDLSLLLEFITSNEE